MTGPLGRIDAQRQALRRGVDLWVLSRYEDVTACLSDHQRFVNSMGNDVDATHDTYGPGQLIALDPPHHGRVRDVLGPAFTPERIAALEPHVRQASRDLLATLRSAGGGDVARDYALPLVFNVSLRLLGMPDPGLPSRPAT